MNEELVTLVLGMAFWFWFIWFIAWDLFIGILEYIGDKLGYGPNTTTARAVEAEPVIEMSSDTESAAQPSEPVPNTTRLMVEIEPRNQNTDEHHDVAVSIRPWTPDPRKAGKPPGWLGLTHQGFKYEFQILRVSDVEIHAYILSHPSYGDRDTGAHETHRYHDSRGYYICCGYRPNNLEELRERIEGWVRYTTKYILTGDTSQ